MLRSSPVAVGSLATIQILNATTGTTLVLGESSTLEVAYVTPIGNSTDYILDGELRVSFNWYFGRADRLFGPFDKAARASEALRFRPRPPLALLL